METKFNYELPHIALKELDSKGYSIDYNLDEHFDSLKAHPDNFVIDYLYRYEGMTDPSDETSVYGIRSVGGQDKGVFVAGNLSFIEGVKREIIVQLEIKSKNHIDK